MSAAKSRTSAVSEEEQYASLKVQARPTGLKVYLPYLPVSMIFSFIGILLFTVVGGVDLKTDLPYVVVVYVIGAIGLAVAYSRVAAWIARQKKGSASKSEQLMFTLFYNNAFYIFLVFLGSHLVFSGFQPTTSMILTQLAAVFIPAWMASLSK